MTSLPSGPVQPSELPVCPGVPRGVPRGVLEEGAGCAADAAGAVDAGLGGEA